jgi:putative heme-binding domain-containing protein
VPDKALSGTARPTSKELVALLKHPNGWHADRARVLLASRRDRSVWPELREMAKQEKDSRLALRGLWALYCAGGLDDDFAAELLKHPADYVRSWCVRLLGDAKTVAAPLAKQFAEMARSDQSPAVRAQLLSTAKRLPGDQALPIIERLLLRDADSADLVIPWLLWWAVESKAISDRDRVTAFFAFAENRKSKAVQANLGRLVRRYAADGTATGYASAHALLTSVTATERLALLPDLDRGLAERAVGLPAVGQGGLFDTLAPPGAATPKPKKYEPLSRELRDLIANHWQHTKKDELSTRLALRANLPEARDCVLADVADANSPRKLLVERLAVLEEFGTEKCAPMVERLLTSKDAEVQKRALAVLARVGAATSGSAIVKAYGAMPEALKPRARDVLFGRAEWARAFLALVDAKAVAPADVPVEQVRLLALLNDKDIDASVKKHWGSVKPGTPEEKLAEVRRFSNDLRAGTGDAAKGKALFAQHCGACHKLFGEGGAVGPDLTTTSRADTAWLLASVVDPGAVVRAQYLQYAVRTTDEVVFTGFVADQDGAGVTLIDAKGEKTRIARERIDSLRELPTSIMPERLLDALSPQERRDLFRYMQQK